MQRVIEAWSPDNSDVIMNRNRDASLVLESFKHAVENGSESATELYERRISPQVGKSGALEQGLSFRTSEAPLVLDVLVSFVRELPAKKILSRRRATSLVGTVALTARHEFGISVSN